jgi:hypothetical protein
VGVLKCRFRVVFPGINSIEGVDGAHPVISVGDNDFSLSLVSDKEYGGELFAVLDFVPVFFHMRIAHPKERKPRCPENILRLESVPGGFSQLICQDVNPIFPVE